MGTKNEIRIGSIVKVITGERAGEICKVVGISNNGLFIEISNSVNPRVLETFDNVLLLEDGVLECPQDAATFF